MIDQDKIEALRAAKCVLIEDIFNCYKKQGREPNGEDFNRLYDLSTYQLHAEFIKEQDRAYFALKA